MKEVDDKGEVADLLELEREALSAYSILVFNKLNMSEDRTEYLEEFIK